MTSHLLFIQHPLRKGLLKLLIAKESYSHTRFDDDDVAPLFGTPPEQRLDGARFPAKDHRETELTPFNRPVLEQLNHLEFDVG
jgi:hypothetical protein